jgi:hypothetical protein
VSNCAYCHNPYRGVCGCAASRGASTARSEPVCRWCHKTKGEHLPPTQLNRPRARMGCLGWQEHFSPQSNLEKLLPKQTGFAGASVPAPGDAASAPSMGDTSSGSSSDAPAPLTIGESHLAQVAAKLVNPNDYTPDEVEVARMVSLSWNSTGWQYVIGLLGRLPRRPTDEQRVAFANELWAKHFELGNAHMDQTLHTYEREAKERLGK